VSLSVWPALPPQYSMFTPVHCSKEKTKMVENAILLILAVGLMIYLFVCLLRPEKF
jgi:K+-transporting ATPase KdpF subunit